MRGIRKTTPSADPIRVPVGEDQPTVQGILQSGRRCVLLTTRRPDSVIERVGRWKGNAWKHYATEDVSQETRYAKRLDSG
jgi:hypothetical protein